MSKNVPIDEKLWAEIQALAKGESNKPVSRGKESVNPVNEGAGFVTFPSAYANGWALAQYKRLGGKWKKESSDFKMPRKWDKDHCESKSCDEMGFSEKASCRPYKNCYEKSASLIPLSKFVKDVVLSGGRYDFSPMKRGKPSLNGMKLSIQGRTVDDIFEVYQVLGGYLKTNQIDYKLATTKRLEKASGLQKHKVMTIYIPDDVDDWREIAEDVSLLLHKHSYRGWHNLSTPPGYEHYANAVFFRNDRDEYGDYIPAGISAKKVAHRYLKLSSIPHKFEEVDLKYHTKHEGLDVLFFLNLQMLEDDGTSWGGDELGCIQGAVYEWDRSYNFDGHCDYDIEVLQEKAGYSPTSSIYLAFVSESEIYEDYLGQRLGDHLYLGFIRHIWDVLKKPFVFAPHYCVPNGSTNPTARKLWGRLTSKYPSSGDCVLISSRP